MAKIQTSLVNTKIVHKRGYYDDRQGKMLKDGEIFYDMTGKGIWMGVAKNGVVTPVQIASVGGGTGNVSDEDLAKLVAKTDIVKQFEDGVEYTDDQVISAKLSHALNEAVASTGAKVEVLEKSFIDGEIAPEVKAYIKKIVVDANFTSSDTISVSLDENDNMSIDVNYNDTLRVDPNTNRLGTSWASYNND